MIQNQNMMNFMNLIRGGGNPEQMVMSMLRNSSNGNPIMQNLLSMANNRDVKGIETVVRNMAREKGIDFDSEFNSFKQMFGL